MEGESLGRQAARDQPADRGVRAGNREDIDTGSDGRSGDLSAGIGNAGRAGIADDGDARALLQLCHELLGARALVVHVIAHGGRANLEVVQQLLRLPGVFAGDAVYLTQHAQRPQGDVFEIADGRGTR